MRTCPVAVVIPAFNAAAHLAEAIDSVLAQTCPPAETIVVDDGSTDGTVDRVRAYGDRITLIRQPNGGQARARNTGIRAARSEWIAFLDADDAWLPDKLERQWALTDPQTAMVYCNRLNVGELDGLPMVQSEVQPVVEGDLFERLLLDGNMITTSGVLVRRALAIERGGFNEDPGIRPAEDWDLWLRVAERHPIRACRTPLVRYRLHAAGDSRATTRMNAARLRVVARALATPRGRSLDAPRRRRIWSTTWATNAWDSARHHRRVEACLSNARAIAWWPFGATPYVALARLALAGS